MRHRPGTLWSADVSLRLDWINKQRVDRKSDARSLAIVAHDKGTVGTYSIGAAQSCGYKVCLCI